MKKEEETKQDAKKQTRREFFKGIGKKTIAVGGMIFAANIFLTEKAHGSTCTSNVCNPVNECTMQTPNICTEGNVCVEENICMNYNQCAPINQCQGTNVCNDNTCYGENICVDDNTCLSSNDCKGGDGSGNVCDKYNNCYITNDCDDGNCCIGENVGS